MTLSCRVRINSLPPLLQRETLGVTQQRQLEIMTRTHLKKWGLILALEDCQGHSESHSVFLGAEDTEGERATETKEQKLETEGRVLRTLNGGAKLELRGQAGPRLGRAPGRPPGNGGVLETSICICNAS